MKWRSHISTAAALAQIIVTLVALWEFSGKLTREQATKETTVRTIVVVVVR